MLDVLDVDADGQVPISVEFPTSLTGLESQVSKHISRYPTSLTGLESQVSKMCPW
jgi:hypothetical protein